MTTTLTRADVHLWRFRLHQPAPVKAALGRTLDEIEQARANRYRMPERQDVARVARGAMRQILATYLTVDAAELRFDLNVHGKPALAPPFERLQFNLSHSGAWALFGVTLHDPIGVDLEAIAPRRRTAQLAERYFSPAERAELSRLPEEVRTHAFYCAWTRKEAYIKARGKGLAIPLDSFDVTLDPAGEPRLTRAADDPDFRRWRLRATPAPEGFVAACIVSGDKRRFIAGEWDCAAGSPCGPVEESE